MESDTTSDTTSEDEYEKLERENNRLKELIKDYGLNLFQCGECHRIDIVEKYESFWCLHCKERYHFDCRKNCQLCDCCDECSLIDRYCSLCR